jgi:hypothetical protein
MKAFLTSGTRTRMFLAVSATLAMEPPCSICAVSNSVDVESISIAFSADEAST